MANSREDGANGKREGWRFETGAFDNGFRTKTPLQAVKVDALSETQVTDLHVGHKKEEMPRLLRKGNIAVPNRIPNLYGLLALRGSEELSLSRN